MHCAYSEPLVKVDEKDVDLSINTTMRGVSTCSVFSSSETQNIVLFVLLLSALLLLLFHFAQFAVIFYCVLDFLSLCGANVAAFDRSRWL